ncbi:hypothetical protein ACJMK2_043401, partial [Sinanodonta woodiana]
PAKRPKLSVQELEMSNSVHQRPSKRPVLSVQDPHNIFVTMKAMGHADFFF